MQTGLVTGISTSLGAGLSPSGARAVVSPAVLTSGADTTDGTSWNTASVSHAAGKLSLILVAHRNGGGSPDVNSITSSGRTWTQVQTSIASNLGVSVWESQEAGATSGVITIGASATLTGVAWCVVELTGASGTINQSKGTYHGNTNSPTDTFSSGLEHPSNLAIAALIIAGGTVASYSTDLTELNNTSSSTPSFWLYVDYAIGATSFSSSWGTAHPTSSVMAEVVAGDA